MWQTCITVSHILELMEYIIQTYLPISFLALLTELFLSAHFYLNV